MPETTRATRGNRSRFSPSSILSLAFWRWCQTGFLMSITTLGMIAAIVIVCAVPLFTDVMNTASLRSMLTEESENAEIEVNLQVMGLSTAITQQLQQEFDEILQEGMGTDKAQLQPAQLSVISLDFDFTESLPENEQRTLVMRGIDMADAASRLGTLQGAMPVTNPDDEVIEILLQRETAQALDVTVGAEIPLRLEFSVAPYSPGDSDDTFRSANVTVRVAGIFAGDPAQAGYWHDNDFKPLVVQDANTGVQLSTFTFLLAHESLLSLHDRLAGQHRIDDIFSTYSAYSVSWYYHLNTERLSIADLDMLIWRMGELRHTYEAYFGDTDQALTFGPPTYPYVERSIFTSPLFARLDNLSNLELFRHRVEVSLIPVLVLTMQILLLILFFVSLMTNLLVERQSDAIALLRSRGASSGQIFGALLTQCLLLSGISFVLGIPLALAMVTLLAQRILTEKTVGALNIISDNLTGVALTSALYALIVLLIVLITMCVSLFLAARRDVLTLRREATRIPHRPLWQRLNLDIIAGILALGSYAISLYLNGMGDVLGEDTSTLVIAPLSIMAPLFLVIGCMLLFLRIFPLLLRVFAFFIARGRGAISMLALAQISRSPRQSIRMTMLLALATAFTIFTLVYTSSEAHHIQQITTYIAGADISGQIPQTRYSEDTVETTKPYQQIAGIQSVSAGYSSRAIGGRGGIPMELRAVDAATFGSVALWPSLEEKSTGDKLLAQLVNQRTSIIAEQTSIVPAIIDTRTADELHLKKNDVVTIHVDNLNMQELQCVVIGVVPYIPTINNRLTVEESTNAPGGILIDYQTYHDVYARGIEQLVEAGDDPFLTIDSPIVNRVWLDVREDDASLANVRSTLTKPALRLIDPLDRPALLTQLTNDPLYLVLSGVLRIGTITALLLALVGNLLASWLSARSRLTSFAVLRAIGTTPAEIAGVLTWEQIIIYITGLLLGMGFGTLLSYNIIPAITYTDLGTNVSQDQFYALQSAFPIQVVVSPMLASGLLALAALFLVALIMMVRMVSLPTLSQTLRLNED